MMLELLKLLEKNARLTMEELSALLDLSEEETAKLLDRAQQEGLIRGYETLVDWEKAGAPHVEAFIELHVQPKKSCGFDEIARMIASFEEVDSVFLMSGGYDLLVRIRGKNFQEIAFFVARRLSTLDDVLSTSTSFILRPYKRGGHEFTEEEVDERECTVL